MSKINKKCFLLMAILILFSLFAFGCKTSTPVESVNFDLTEIGGEEISLLVGDEYSPKITFVPTFATDKGYAFYSSDENVLKINGRNIVAVAQGQAVLTVVASDNSTIQNTVLVKVYSSTNELATPNLNYNSTSQKFYFGEVLGANSYTISINNNEINLGNSLEYSLVEYAQKHQAYDVELVAKVRANAPTYSNAKTSSKYSEVVRIYQVGQVKNVKIEVDENGVSNLTFTHEKASNFDITINGELQTGWQNTESKIISLMALPEKYANQNVKLQIGARVNSDVADNYPAALSYPSLSEDYYINVLAVPELKLNASVVVWQSVPFASGYNIYIDGEKIETTTNCSYDLNLLDSEKYKNSETNYNLTVEPVLMGSNLAKTAKQSNIIEFNRNADVNLEIKNEKLTWQANDKDSFSLELFIGEEQQKNFATTKGEYDLAYVDNNIYEIKIVHLAQFVENVYYLNSKESAIKISRLSTPVLNYNKQENKFSIEDNNPEQNVSKYQLNYSLGQTNFDNKNIEDFNVNFSVGENEFVLTAISKGEVDGVNYLNSKPYNITINKLNKVSSLSLKFNDFEQENEFNFFNYLEIDSGAEQEYVLCLTINAAGSALKFKTENGNLISVDGKGYSLPYIYGSGKFYIALLDENYLPKINELKNEEEATVSFSVDAVLDGTTNLEVASETVSAEFSICGKTTVSGAEQRIEIKNINPSSAAENYFVLINDHILYNLDAENSVLTGEKVNVEFANLIKFLQEQDVDLTKQIDIKVLNCNANSIATLSDNFAAKLAEMPDITISKNVLDFKANNAIEISAAKRETQYKKQVVFKIYNETKSINETLSFDDQTEAKFYLEQIENYSKFDGEIYVSAYVTILSQENDFSVYMFNSIETNPIKFTKKAAVSNLKIDNGILNFTNPNDNIAFFEIYSVSGDQFSKIGTSINTNFDLKDVEINEKFNLAVKAIASCEVGAIPPSSNSDYSEQISAQKVALDLKIENGDFVITCAQLNSLKTMFEATEENNNAYLKISNLTNEKTLLISANEQETIAGVNFDFANNKIKIEAHLILNYGEQISIEKLVFQIVVKYVESEESESFYYINSAEKNINVSGLIKPSSLSVKFTTTDSELVDYIDWTNDKNPQDLSYGYVLKLTYQGTTYSSLEGKFESNGAAIDFDGNKIKLPNKFIKNGGEPVEFGEGGYLLEIKIYPNSTSERINYCSSAYMSAEIELLFTPTLSVDNGNLIWGIDENAQGYQIKIETKSSENAKTIYLTTTSPQFDFNSALLDDVSGVLSVQVQAVSLIKNETDNNILKSVANSKWSESLPVYKLTNLGMANIDDGTLVLTANKFFNTAEIEFVYDGTTTSYIYDNETYANEQLSALDIEQWDNLAEEKQSTLKSTRKYLIDLNKPDKTGEKINLIEGITYSINVRLKGNSFNTDSELKLPIINSAKTTANLTATKLKRADAKASERGKLNFTIDRNISLNTLNYNFDEEESGLADIDGVKARIYKIDITILENTYSIYALDYNYFVKKVENLPKENYATYVGEKNSLYGYLKIASNGNEIYLNVYKDFDKDTPNILDFTKSIIYYYDTTAGLDETNGKFTYSSSQQLNEINVASGGNVLVNVYLLGGDSDVEQGIANLSSPAIERNFYRYAINSLETSNGEIRFKDLIKLDSSENAIDYPIYKIIAASTSGSKTIYLYYGENNLESVKSFVQDNGAEYFEITKFVNEQNTKFVWFEISKILAGATYYDINIQTLAGFGVDNNANYLLNAISAGNKLHVYKLGIADLGIDLTNGVNAKFSLADRETYNYEITLKDLQNPEAEDIVYVVNQNSEGVTILNDSMLYALPKKIMSNSGEEVELKSTYSITIRAMAFDQDIINGSYNANSYSVRRAEDILDFKIEDGVLKLSAPSKISRAYVSVSYQLSGVKKYLHFIVSGNLENATYNFSDEPIYSSEAITADKDYELNAYSLGYVDNGIYALNGAFKDEGILLNRLETVKELFAQNGVLTWTEVQDTKKYSVTISGQSNAFESDTTTLDLDSLPSGTYSISVRALGDDKINSMNSTTQTFKKLDKVKEEFELSGNTITWQTVADADEYYYEFEYNFGGGTQIERNSTSDNYANTPSGLSGQFKFRIQARSTGKNYVLNSQFTTYSSSIEVPQAVENIEWDENNYRFIITTATDFAASDKIEIVCDVNKYEYSNGQVSLKSVLPLPTYTIPYNRENNNVYYFYPSIMGVYSSVSARVVREKSLSSGRMSYSQQLDLHLFAAGDGADTPYAINNIDNLPSTTQLLNIRFRPDAKYVLGQTVDFSSVSITNYNGIFADTFTGEFNGGGFAINGINATISNTNFSLFKTLNGAKIYNLTLGDGNSSITANFNNANEIYLAVLAQKSDSSTLQKITVNKTKIIASGSAISNVYVSGLVASAQNTTFEGCSATIDVDYRVTSSSYKYVGGMVAYASGGEFKSYTETNTSANLTTTSTNETNAQITYLGGLIGYFTSAQQTGKISSAKTVVNIKSTNAANVGGIAGFVTNITVEDSEVSGTISTATLTTESKINLGGIVGTMQSSTLTNSGVRADITIDILQNATRTSGIRLGILVGEISIVSGNKSIISNCYSYTDFNSGITNLQSTPFKLGVYGYLISNAIDGIPTCSKK